MSDMELQPETTATQDDSTAAELDALKIARSDWFKAIRGQAWIVFGIATMSFSAIEVMGNEDGVNSYWRNISAVKPIKPVPWNVEAGLDRGDVVVFATALLVGVIALTVAVVASPRVTAERTITDRVALAYWGQYAPRISAILAGISWGVSAPLCRQEPSTVAVLIAINVPLSILAIITIQRIYDRRAVLMASLQVRELELAKTWFRKSLPTHRPPWSFWLNFYVTLVLCALTCVLIVLGVLFGLQDKPIPKPAAGDVLYLVFIILLVTWLASISLAPSILCFMWSWRARSGSSKRQARVATWTSFVAPVLWGVLGVTLLQVSDHPIDPPIWLADILWSGPIFLFLAYAGLTFLWGRGPLTNAGFYAARQVQADLDAANAEVERLSTIQVLPDANASSTPPILATNEESQVDSVPGAPPAPEGVVRRPLEEGIPRGYGVGRS